MLGRLGFEEALSKVDLLITGEGAWDATSGLGKITWEILRRARSVDVPALLVCGTITGPTPPGVTAVGGDILLVEAAASATDKGDLRLTGSLGDVMKESAAAAVTFALSASPLRPLNTLPPLSTKGTRAGRSSVTLCPIWRAR